MRIVFDLDGTIVPLRKPHEAYSSLTPISGVVEKMRELKKAGHTIIISTARNMKTQGGNQHLVLAQQGLVTLKWLKKYKIPYDEIQFGKPYGEVYIDDLAQTFVSSSTIRTSDFDQEKVNVVIPMAGKGSRFVAAGYTDTPKPLIPVLGKEMIAWAMKSFDFLDKIKNTQLLFIVLREHQEKFNIGNKLYSLFGKNCIVETIDSVSHGQAETCLAVKDHINNFNKLFIYNCDTFSIGPVWNDITTFQPDGLLSVFNASDPRYSFASIDDQGYVVKTAEKKAISQYASTGLYYFRHGRDFVLAAEHQIAQKNTINNEYYVAPLYNTLIERGKKIRVSQVTEHWVLGTPEEFEIFKKNYKIVKKK